MISTSDRPWRSCWCSPGPRTWAPCCIVRDCGFRDKCRRCSVSSLKRRPSRRGQILAAWLMHCPSSASRNRCGGSSVALLASPRSRTCSLQAGKAPLRDASGGEGLVGYTQGMVGGSVGYRQGAGQVAERAGFDWMMNWRFLWGEGVGQAMRSAIGMK